MITDILCAIGSGACIGFERQIKNKSAGLKTNVLICLGACLYTEIGLMVDGDKSRIIAQIVSGIGFLGAGCVFKNQGDYVSGLTTAAIVWLVASLGVLCGLGHGYETIGLSVCITLLIVCLNWLERKFIPR
jgi:putative Mg2+ transporter-C (MgtC) family protein